MKVSTLVKSIITHFTWILVLMQDETTTKMTIEKGQKVMNYIQVYETQITS